MFSRKIHHLRHFGLGNLIGKDTTFAHAMVMNVEHDLGGRLGRFVEKALQDEDHKLHRGVIVIQQQHTVKAWLLRLGLGAGDNGRAIVAAMINAATLASGVQGGCGTCACHAVL